MVPVVVSFVKLFWHIKGPSNQSCRLPFKKPAVPASASIFDMIPYRNILVILIEVMFNISDQSVLVKNQIPISLVLQSGQFTSSCSGLRLFILFRFLKRTIIKSWTVCTGFDVSIFQTCWSRKWIHQFHPFLFMHWFPRICKDAAGGIKSTGPSKSTTETKIME